MEKKVDNKLMMLAMTCSMFDSPFISDGDDIKTDILILTCLELTVNSYWEKKTLLWGNTQFGKEGKKYKRKNNSIGKKLPEINARSLRI